MEERVETRRMSVEKEPDGDFTAARLRADVLSIEDEREKREAAKRPKWRKLPDVVDEIWSRKDEPWVELKLVDDGLVRVRAGGIVVVMGGTGGGKSSLIMNLLMQHARDIGPVVVCSIELPADEFGARGAGIKCDASWEDVLTGKIPYDQLRIALDLPRFYVLDREDATMDNFADCLDAARREYPGQPILAAVDYAQIIESKEREVRMRVADAFKQIDQVARSRRVVTIAVSQMSRAGSDAATSGEKIGSETTGLGAESAAIERYATATITLGKKGEPREDGSQHVDCSIGKGRMSGGDRVIPMNFWGRSGLFRVAGEAKTAAVVRAERDEQKTALQARDLEQRLVGAAHRSNEPLSRDQLMELVTGRKATKKTAITVLLGSGELVEVARRASRSRTSWCIWTRDRAAQAGIKLKSELEDDRS
jgi:KaiC/GvpD/RAD55 family RecA-like ATPase